jgi:hypothetical protein
MATNEQLDEHPPWEEIAVNPQPLCANGKKCAPVFCQAQHAMLNVQPFSLSSSRVHSVSIGGGWRAALPRSCDLDGCGAGEEVSTTTPSLL